MIWNKDYFRYIIWKNKNFKRVRNLIRSFGEKEYNKLDSFVINGFLFGYWYENLKYRRRK